MRSLARLWHGAIARLCWFDLRLLRTQQRDSALLIVALEAELTLPLTTRRRKNVEHDLANERRYLAGIDEAIRITNQQATRAAMAAQL